MRMFAIYAFFLVFALVGLGWYASSYLSEREIFPEDTKTQPPPLSGSSDESGTILFVRTSDGDAHIYRGVIDLPTPCHTLKTNVLVAESYPEQVTIQLEVENPAPDVVCIQVIDTREFSVEFSAHPNHTLRATLNGMPVRLEISEE